MLQLRKTNSCCAYGNSNNQAQLTPLLPLFNGSHISYVIKKEIQPTPMNCWLPWLMTSVNLSHKYFRDKCPQRSNVPIATRWWPRQTTRRISLYTSLRTRALLCQRNYITSSNPRRLKAKTHFGERHAKNPAGRQKHSLTHTFPPF